MKMFFRVLSAFTILTISACANLNSQTSTPSPIPPKGSEIHSIFSGVTPCSAGAGALPQIPPDTDCEQMIWNLVLYHDPQTGTPTTYRLNSAYGLSKPNTNELVDGGTSIVMEGTWAITTGTKNNPYATVYQINPDDPQTAVSFLKVGGNLLHVLNSEKALLVGNGAWSYTLNRMDDQNPLQPVISADTFPEPAVRPPLPPVPIGSSVFGVFDGRTPCHDLIVEFMQTTPFPGCLKIKLRLTLYQDSVTNAPGGFLLIGTSTYREGMWGILLGMDNTPDTVIYQLYADDGQRPVSLLRVDENHLFLLDGDLNLLVGNELFSYTLSRIDPGVQ